MKKQLPLRILRIMIGLFAMIVGKACTEPAITGLAGDVGALKTFALRAGLAILAFALFFQLRSVINARHHSASGDERPLLPAAWTL